MRQATARPRYATPRTPSRPSFGGAIARVAEALGKPLQDWQRQVVDVGTELVPDADGSIIVAGERYSWAYRTVVVHVQRQAGKTTLLGPKNLHRCLTRPGVKCWLTAQTRQDGRDTWRDVAELVSRSPLAGVVTTRRSNGSEELTVTGSGSSFRVFAPSEDALHGKANESVDVDEAWAFDGVQGMALQQAILPTFSTTGGQLWLTSTAGTAASTWLRGYIDRGRAAVAGGMTEGIAYFEWSLSPADALRATELLTEVRQAPALTDQLLAKLDQVLDLVMAAHPGAYVRRDAVKDAALSMSPGEFLRAYGNVWTLTADQVIADHLWAACRDRTAGYPEAMPMPEPGTLALSFAVAIDRSCASVSGSWRVGHRRAVDVIDSRPGVSWMADRIEQLAERYQVREVGYDGAGAALDVADELARRGKVTLRKLTTSEYITACAAMLQAVNDQVLLHRGSAALDTAVAAAARREIGDAGWAWSRRNSAGSIAELEAATVASFTLDHRPAPVAGPVIASRSTGADRPRAARRPVTSLTA